MFVPQGYRYAVRLTVTNPSAYTMGGSTQTPQASPTDYVVQLHLPGDSTLAGQILANATDKTAFNDVTVWFGATQLDIDYDTTAHGAWNSTNGLTLWFKLQASIAAGAIDPNYLLAWGSVNTSPTALRNLANIYPFADDFTADGGSLDTTYRWTISSSPAPAVSFLPTSNWLQLNTPSGPAVGYAYIQSQTSFGAGYRITMYGKQPQPTVPKTQIGNGLANRSGASAPFAQTYTSNGAVTVAEKNSGAAQTATLSSTPDGDRHFFEVWRDANSTPTAGRAHGWLDGVTVQVATGQESITAEPVQLFVWNSATGDTQTVYLYAKFIKVRAWNGTEAIVSAGYAYVPVGYQYAQRLSVTNPSATLAMSGSTTLPNSSDVVVQLHLAPDDALDILNLSSFKASDFRDVTLWYGATQIDIDYDTLTNGPWDSTNGITLWFKLQATIPPNGTDSNYILAWGNSSPMVLRTLANIYPFYDIFTTESALDSSKWSLSSSPNPVPSLTFDSTNGLTLSTPSGSAVGYAFIQSAVTFGPGYRLAMFGKQLQPTHYNAQIGNGIANRSGAVAPFADVQTSNNAVTLLEKNSGTAQTATLASPPDTTTAHVYAIWRDANSSPVGLAHGWLDGTTVPVGTGQEFSTAQAVQLFVWNSVDSQTVTMSVQFVKVSPYIGVDATVALASVVRTQGFPRIANVLGLDTNGGQAATMARYALLIGNNSLFQVNSGQPIIDTVRRARSGANADMALIIYQSSVEVDYSPTTGALSANQPTIYDDAVRGTWWLFYANATTTTASIPAGSPGDTLTLTIASSSAIYTDTAPLIRIDNETMLVTGGLGTTSLTVKRGALGTATPAHSSGATVKQHVGITNATFSSVLFNIASTLTNGAGQTPPAYLAQYILANLAALWGVDGVFLDNVTIAPTFVKHYDHLDIGTPWSGTAATYSQLVKAWAPAEQSLHDTLRVASALLTICGNGTVYPASNGREIEHFPYLDPFLGSMIPPTAPAFLAAGIFPGYLQMALVAANPVTIVNPDTASLDDTTYYGASHISLQQMRLDLGLALLANGLYAYDGGGQDHGDPWWFDEYDEGADSSLTVAAPQSSPNHITVSTATAASYTNGDQLYIPNDGGSGLKYDEVATIQAVGSGGDLTLTANIVNAHRTLQKVLRQATYPKNIGWLGQPLENPVSLSPLPTPPAGNLTTDWDFSNYNSGTHQFTSWPLTAVPLTHSSGTVATDIGPNGGSDQCARITVTTIDLIINAFNLYMAQGGLALSANVTYTLTFWAKTSSPYGFPLVAMFATAAGGSALVRETYTLGSTWQQYTLTYTVGTSAITAAVEFAFASVTSDATGDVFLDKVTVQQGDPNLWKREFENGMVVVNATGQTQTNIPLPSAGTGRSWYRINGTQDHTTNSGAGPLTTIASLQAGDAVLLIRV